MMMNTIPISSKRQVLEAKNLAYTEITVFTDRALVKRSVEVNLQVGINEVVLHGLCNSLEDESVTVDADIGVNIKDVVFDHKPAKQQNLPDKNKANQLEEKVMHNQMKLEELLQIEILINQQRDVLNKVTKNLGNFFSTSESKDKGSKVLVTASPKDMDRWLDYFEERATGLAAKRVKICAEKKRIEEDIECVYQKISQLDRGHHKDSLAQKELSIFVETSIDRTSRISMSYIVHNVAWRPCYDIRLTSDCNKMILQYFGKIDQKSGEDWTNAKLLLSTSVPGIAANVPWLPVLSVTSKEPANSINQMASAVQQVRRSNLARSASDDLAHSARVGFRLRNLTIRRRKNNATAPVTPGTETQAAASNAPLEEATEAKVQESTIVSGVTVTFEINGPPVTVPNGTNDYKVTVLEHELEPIIKHISVPSKTAQAYMKATAANNSVHSFLPGPVNIFVDNNFVAKTHFLKSIGINEKFTVALGVDPKVQVHMSHGESYACESWFMNKMTSTVTAHKLQIRNSRQDQLTLKLLLQLPKSDTEKVKVHLIEPELNEDSARMKSDHIVEYTMTVAAGGADDDVPFRYRVEHAPDMQLVFTEKF